MLEPSLFAALTALGKAAVSDAAKQRLKEWLADAVRVRRTIQKTANTFSTQLPGLQDALTVWVETEAFRAAMQDLITGKVLPENLTTADEFLSVTGLGFGDASPAVVGDMLAVFFGNIRAELVSAHHGLTLVDNRMGELQRELRQLRAELAAMAASAGPEARISIEFLNQIAQTQGWGSGLGYGPEIHINLELPPAVQNLASRVRAVQKINEILKVTVWYAMYGGSGSGKTQLAILIARACVGQKVWIRLGGSPLASGLILESALTTLSARQSGQSIQKWCEAVCAALGAGSLIVIDDLPCTSGDPALYECVAALCAACAETGVRLLTTSPGPLVPGLRAVVGNRVHEAAVPDLREEDIRDLFRSYGAPESFLTSRWLTFVHHAAKRHPMLLVEAARYLRAREWATDDRSFDDLAKGTFASALDLPTAARIRSTVPEQAAREFLYRLKVIGWPFGIEEVQRISAVPPPVSLPLEHLAAVLGLWVQQDSAGEYTLSPLLARMADDNLPKELQQAVHVALAEGILQKRKLGPLQACQAIGHFVAAGDMKNAALVVMVVWHAMLSMPEARDPYALTSVWADMPIPAAIDLEKRIYLRSLQVILRRRVGLSERYEQTDLDRLMSEGESDDNCQLVIAGAGALLATYLGDRDPALAIRSVARSIKAHRRVARDIERNQELDLGAGLLGLLWAIPAWIRSDAQYEQWFAIVRGLSPNEVYQWRRSALADQGSKVVCSGVWTRTADLPEAARNWAHVLEQLEQLQTWARSASVLPLATSALCSQIIVLAEYQQELPKAEALARSGMEEFGDVPKSQFAIADTIARQHYYFGQAADAVRWFGLDFAHGEGLASSGSVASLTLAGIAASGVDFELARRYLEQAARTAAATGVGAMARVTAGGELGVLLWNAGQHADAFAAWSAAAKVLLEARNEDKKWKTLFLLFGNCTGYFLSSARDLPVNDAEVAVPFSGILLREIKDIDELHRPDQDWVLPVQMAMLAESVGAFDEALEWARRTTVGSGPMGIAARAILGGLRIADEVPAHQFAEIIRAADLVDLDGTADAQDLAHLDDEHRAQRLARFTARLNLVALAIEVARVGLHDPAAAERLSQTAAALSRDCATRHGGSQMWSGAADVFDALTHAGVSWGELWDKAAAAQEQGNSALQGMYAIAAAAAAGPRQAVQIQLRTLPWLEQFFSPTLYHVTVAKFVPEYWLSAIDRSPMSFGLLVRTRRAITDARGPDDKARVHTILHMVAFSLGVSVPDDIQRWLDDAPLGQSRDAPVPKAEA